MISISKIKKKRQKLGLNVALVQFPMGLESDFKGIVDVLEEKAYYFDGPCGLEDYKFLLNSIVQTD